LNEVREKPTNSISDVSITDIKVETKKPSTISSDRSSLSFLLKTTRRDTPGRTSREGNATIALSSGGAPTKERPK